MENNKTVKECDVISNRLTCLYSYYTHSSISKNRIFFIPHLHTRTRTYNNKNRSRLSLSAQPSLFPIFCSSVDKGITSQRFRLAYKFSRNMSAVHSRKAMLQSLQHPLILWREKFVRNNFSRASLFSLYM